MSVDPPRTIRGTSSEAPSKPATPRRKGRAKSPLQSESSTQWPSPQFVLGDYLDELGVEEPRRVAAGLLQDFGSISGILSASWWQLRRSAGFRLAGLISASRDLMRAALVEDISKGPRVTSRSELFDLLKLELGARARERVIAVYVDSKLHLLRLERVADGTSARCPMPVQRIIHIGLDVGAAGILVVHNHPSGDPTPSDEDRRAMATLSRIACELDMYLLDAWVVAGSSVCSILK